MDAQTEAAKSLMDYGVTGAMLVFCIIAVTRIAMSFKNSVEKHQETINELNTAHNDRIDKRDAEHEKAVSEIMTVSRLEREKLINSLDLNTKALNDISRAIEKRGSLDLR